MTDENSRPVVRAARALVGYVFMPVLVGLAWWKALDFDPYSTSFFTKIYIEPTPGMPDEMRIGGWVFIGIGAVLLAALLNGLWRRRVMLRNVWQVGWMGLLLMAFGGSFFLAADRAEVAIALRKTGL